MNPKKELFNRNKIVWVAYALLLCASAWVFLSDIFGHLIVNADDFHYLTQSARISKNFGALLDPQYHGSRPLADIVFWLGFELWGTEAKWFHTLVACCFTTACFLLALVCREMGLSNNLSFLAGAFFLTTVAHFRNLYLISGLSYHLALIMVFGGVIFYLRGVQKNDWRWCVGYTTVLFLAMLSHPAAVFILPFCLFVTFNKRQDVRSGLVFLLPATVAMGSTAFCLIYFFPDKIQTYHSLYLPDLSNLANNFFWLLSRLITTAHWVLLPVYKFQKWESVVGMVGLLVLAFLLFRRGKPETVWAMWTLVALAPFINRMPRSFEIGTSGPSHYVYFASVGTSVLLACMLLRVKEVIELRWGNVIGYAICYGLVIAIILSSFSAFDKLQAFSYYSSGNFHIEKRDLTTGIGQLYKAQNIANSEYVLPQDDVFIALCHASILRGENIDMLLQRGMMRFPQNSKLQALYGAIESTRKDSLSKIRGLAAIKAARFDFLASGNQSIFLVQMATTYKCLAEAFNMIEKSEQSLEASRMSLQYDDDHRTHFNIGVSYMLSGETHKGIEAFEESVRLSPLLGEALVNLGVLYSKIGRHHDAIERLSRAADAMEENSRIYFQLGFSHSRIGENKAAVDAFNKAIDIDPDYADAHYNKGSIHLKNENFTKAIKSFGEVIRLNAGNVDAYLGMGAAYIGSGNGQAAISTYERVIRLQPKSRNARYHLFVENKRIGNEKAAQSHLDLLERLDPALAAHAKNQFE